MLPHVEKIFLTTVQGYGIISKCGRIKCVRISCASVQLSPTAQRGRKVSVFAAPKLASNP